MDGTYCPKCKTGLTIDQYRALRACPQCGTSFIAVRRKILIFLYLFFITIGSLSVIADLIRKGRVFDSPRENAKLIVFYIAQLPFIAIWKLMDTILVKIMGKPGIIGAFIVSLVTVGILAAPLWLGLVDYVTSLLMNP